MEFIETKVTKKEFIDIENAIYDGYVKSERTAFEQGFMRASWWRKAVWYDRERILYIMHPHDCGNGRFVPETG